MIDTEGKEELYEKAELPGLPDCRCTPELREKIEEEEKEVDLP